MYKIVVLLCKIQIIYGRGQKSMVMIYVCLERMVGGSVVVHVFKFNKY